MPEHVQHPGRPGVGPHHVTLEAHPVDRVPDGRLGPGQVGVRLVVGAADELDPALGDEPPHVGPVLGVGVEVRLQVVELGQHELVVPVGAGLGQVQPDQVERGAHVRQRAVLLRQEQARLGELALGAPPDRVVVEVADHPHGPARLGRRHLGGKLGPVAARPPRSRPGARPRPGSGHRLGHGRHRPGRARLIRRGELHRHLDRRGHPRRHPGQASRRGVVTPAPSTRTCMAPVGSDASLATLTWMICRGRAALPANSSVEMTAVIRIGSSFHANRCSNTRAGPRSGRVPSGRPVLAGFLQAEVPGRRVPPSRGPGPAGLPRPGVPGRLELRPAARLPVELPPRGCPPWPRDHPPRSAHAPLARDRPNPAARAPRPGPRTTRAPAQGPPAPRPRGRQPASPRLAQGRPPCPAPRAQWRH